MQVFTNINNDTTISTGPVCALASGLEKVNY